MVKNNAKVNAQSPVDAPAVVEQSQSDEEQVVENDKDAGQSHPKGDNKTGDISDGSNGFEAVNMDKSDGGQQNSDKGSMEAGSGK